MESGLTEYFAYLKDGLAETGPFVPKPFYRRESDTLAPSTARSINSSRPQQAKNWPGLVKSTLMPMAADCVTAQDLHRFARLDCALRKGHNCDGPPSA